MVRLKQIGIDVDVHRAIEQARLSFSENENDILRRVLLSHPATKQHRRPDQGRSDSRDPSVRVRGLWSIEIKGARESAANMKDAYQSVLLKLNDICPEFLEKFALERSRSRRFVARDPADLYDSSPHLVADYARPLKDGWYFDTNLSAEQVAARVRVAARVAGLLYGRDVKLQENLRLI